jgi:hypothetical protein
MATKKKQGGEDKYKEPFKILVKKTGKTKSEISVQEVKPFAPKIPVIDLTPSTITMRYEKEKLVEKFFKMVVAIVLMFASIWGLNLTMAGVQGSSNSATIDKIVSLQQDLGAVEGYRVYVDGIKLVRENMYSILKDNIDMSVAIRTIVSSANSNGISVTSIKITETATSTDQNVCVTSGDNNNKASIGCVTLSGSAPNNEAVIKFFSDILKNNDGFSDSFINSIGVSGNSIVFSGTITLNEALKVTRFNYLSTELVSIDAILSEGGLSDDAINKLLSGAAGNATATTEPAYTQRFATCEEAIAAGEGDYKVGVDPEAEFHEDTDNNGMVCEK